MPWMHQDVAETTDKFEELGVIAFCAKNVLYLEMNFYWHEVQCRPLFKMIFITGF